MRRRVGRSVGAPGAQDKHRGLRRGVPGLGGGAVLATGTRADLGERAVTESGRTSGWSSCQEDTCPR